MRGSDQRTGEMRPVSLSVLAGSPVGRRYCQRTGSMPRLDAVHGLRFGSGTQLWPVTEHMIVRPKSEMQRLAHLIEGIVLLQEGVDLSEDQVDLGGVCMGRSQRRQAKRRLLA